MEFLKKSYELSPETSTFIIENTLDNLNYKTFLKNPYEYYMNLKILYDMKDDYIKESVKEIITDTSVYETYFSTPLHWIIMIVGELIEPEQAEMCYFSRISINP